MIAVQIFYTQKCTNYCQASCSKRSKLNIFFDLAMAVPKNCDAKTGHAQLLNVMKDTIYNGRLDILGLNLFVSESTTYCHE